MKKAKLGLIATLILVNFSFAKDFTLDEAIELAKQNNSNLITLKAEQRQQEKDYKSANVLYRKYSESIKYALLQKHNSGVKVEVM